MQAVKKNSQVDIESKSVVSLVLLIITVFLSLVVFIWITNNDSLNQQQVVLEQDLIESKKMLINSELMELARKRTRLTSQIMDSEDFFRKDELNIELEAYAGEFSKLRKQIFSLPLNDKELAILEKNDAIISQILPAQREVTELAMSDNEDNLLLAKEIFYSTVLPGQNDLIDGFRSLVAMEQIKIGSLTEQIQQSLKTNKETLINTVAIGLIFSILFSIIVVLRILNIQFKLRSNSQELLLLNQNLEAQVNERTKELTELNALLKESSERDELTKLFNRRKFNEYINVEYNRANRDKGSFSLVLVDIDFFKQYNDGYGHQKGDECLVSVAAIMKGCLPRSTDFIARYGGEEFVMILPSTNAEGAIKVAECVRGNVLKASIPHEYSDTSADVTISLGVTTYLSGDLRSISEIIESADQALYKAKKGGRNRVESN
ncbi:GGDEF domain-containing protein [Thiomicrorhabdus lithotrophica]|uniref:diguanylate cyclase n=1 Tax=Thiomicrorhabdus lithotrophica TaxID=2949997 RepID=A0ABY8C7Y5_9GAMM|nr:GGDEF domain-containing protein [Thiomicrorhabdus lithotrophica]WEJ61662.1 GGDEF domain-containing protein [Thiomicrorhabdus lithotrophica]